MSFLPPSTRAFSKQFTAIAFIRILFVELVRRIFDSGAQLSYSSAGEDIVLKKIFLGRIGTYVDVGCNLADLTSNTFGLYKMGWRGLCIDADESLIAQHRRLRPRDRQRTAAVSDVRQEVTFSKFKLDNQIGSIDAGYSERASAGRTDKIEIRLTSETLTEILDSENIPLRFDLLTVDVEGHDLPALRSLDFTRYRPRVVIVEILCLELAEAANHPIVMHLLAQGYRMFGYIMQNAYFTDLSTD